MDDIARRGRTVLFISHNMEAVQRLCTRGLLMDRGRLVASGAIGDVVAQYRNVEQSLVDIGRLNTRGRTGTGWAKVVDVRLIDAEGHRVAAVAAEHDLVFEVDLQLAAASSQGASLRGLIVELVICSEQGQPLLSLMNVDDDGVELPSATNCTVTARLPGPTFIPGRYRLNLFVGIPNLEHVDEISDAFEFEVTAPDRPWRPYELFAARGIVCRRAQWACVVSDSLRA
jgi:lipopolysaccharide transport system ATP-binding protein